eukprot:UN28549
MKDDIDRNTMAQSKNELQLAQSLNSETPNLNSETPNPNVRTSSDKPPEEEEKNIETLQNNETDWRVWNYPTNSKSSSKDIDCCPVVEIPSCCYSYRIGNMYVFCDCKHSDTKDIEDQNYKFPCVTSHQYLP